MEIAPENSFAAVTLSQARSRIEDRFLPIQSPIAFSELPRDPDILYILGQAQRREGDMERSVSLWEETVRLAPEHAEALADLGVARIVQGDTAVGLGFLEKAVRADPGLAAPWINLARIYLGRGDRQGAQTALTRFLEISDPRMPNEIQWAERVLAALGGR
jgi:cytochrome c-type biogenesis protein CcmH/NrfG